MPMPAGHQLLLDIQVEIYCLYFSFMLFLIAFATWIVDLFLYVLRQMANVAEASALPSASLFFSLRFSPSPF